MIQNTLPASEDARQRGCWLAVALVDLVLFVASVPAYWNQLNNLCTDSSRVTCNFLQLNLLKLQVLERLETTIGACAAYALPIHVVTSLALLLIVGVLIFWCRSGDRYGLFVPLFTGTGVRSR